MTINHFALNLILTTSLLFTAACSCEREADPHNSEVDIDETSDQISPAKEGSTTEVSEVANGAGDGINIDNTYTDQYGNIVYTIVEQNPSFEGGEQELYKFLAANLKYPQEAIEKGATGVVHVAFVVSKDGTIKDVELARGVNESSLNKEAMRVVSEMPNWTPGMQNGENVNVKYTLPVKFDLKN